MIRLTSSVGPVLDINLFVSICLLSYIGQQLRTTATPDTLASICLAANGYCLEEDPPQRGMLHRTLLSKWGTRDLRCLRQFVSVPNGKVESGRSVFTRIKIRFWRNPKDKVISHYKWAPLNEEKLNSSIRPAAL